VNFPVILKEASVATSNSLSSVSNITSQQFLQLLVSQLQNQDPLNPVDPSSFLNSLASLDTVGSIGSLNASFSSMLQLEQLTSGTSLIGQTVTYTPTDGGASVSGKVSGLTVQNGQFYVQVGNSQVGLSQITNVG
jgi:flagellar basal-body rod modification protein FlgD